MRSKQGLLLLFLFMAFLFLCIHHLSAVSDIVEYIKESDQERGSAAITHHSELSHGSVGGGGNGGNPTVTGGSPEVSGGSGGSHSPYMQGGGGVTPLYAAGAGSNNHHPHRGGGNRSKGRRGLDSLAIIMFVWLLLCVNNQDL